MSKLTLEQVESIIESYKYSDIYQYYSKYGEGRVVGYAKQKLYAKTPRGKKNLEKSHTISSESRKIAVKKYWQSVSSNQRSEWSKQGWNKEVGYEERRERIVKLNKERAEINSELLSKYNQDSIHQAKRGSVGGKIAGPMVANRVHHCKYCKHDFKNLPYNKYHGERCKKNPNRVIIYKYELVMDGKFFGMFEEKQDIATYLECSSALISKYMSGKKNDIKGYQIETMEQS